MKRILILITCLLLLLFSYLFIPETIVNYNMSQYLPKESNTSLGTNLLVEEFGKESQIQVMISDIDVEDLLEIISEIEGVNHVSTVIWLDDYVDLNTVPIEYIDSSILNSFYIESDALISIIFELDSYSLDLMSPIHEIEDILADYQVYMRGQPLNHIENREIANQEIVKIMFLLVPIILVLLLLSSHAWFEPVLIIITLGFAALFNLISNGLLPSVSFITLTMSLALQLALSIDYALFMIHRYYEERATHSAIDSSKLALKHSFKPITISALTTIAGFSALSLMHYTIGLDIAIVLSKGILFSYASTMLILPILLIWFDPILQKSKHKMFFPSFILLARFQYKYRNFIFIFFILCLGFGFIMQSKTSYLFGESSDGNPNSQLNIDLDIMNDKFGPNNVIVILVPNHDIENEVSLVADLIRMEEILSINALVLSVDPNIPREFLPAEVKDYYIGENYSRIILTTNIYKENEELYLFVEGLRESIDSKYDDFYIIGESTALYDIKNSIEKQGIWIMLLTILGVSLIVGVVFKSYKIPILLVSVILSAIWLNVSVLVIGDLSILYIGYLIVMSIQLGATIDYAVLLTHRYIEERKENEKEQAMLNAFSKSSISIIISGAILTVAGFVEGWFSNIGSVTKIGELLGRGAFISLMMILFFLPVILLVFDRQIIKK
ncbi:MAG: MMPL family transporter [Firmicutes bacterium]|nr:MMPL family transporter [Bacillota bacterium]